MPSDLKHMPGEPDSDREIGSPSTDRTAPAGGSRGFAFRTVQLGLSFVVATGLAWSWLAYKTGSFAASMSYMEGNYIFLPEAVDVSGDGASGQSVSFTNLTGRTIQITRYRPSCPCVAFSGIPVNLGPHERKEVPVKAISLVDKTVDVLFSTDPSAANQVHVVIRIIAKQM